MDEKGARRLANENKITYHTRVIELHTSALERKTSRVGHCNAEDSNDPVFLWFSTGRGGGGTV